MSQWHTRDGIADGNAYRVLFHVPIPSANNRVAVNYRTALLGTGIGGLTVMTEATPQDKSRPLKKQQSKTARFWKSPARSTRGRARRQPS